MKACATSFDMENIVSRPRLTASISSVDRGTVPVTLIRKHGSYGGQQINNKRTRCTQDTSFRDEAFVFWGLVVKLEQPRPTEFFTTSCMLLSVDCNEMIYCSGAASN